MQFETYLRDALGKEISEFRVSASIRDGKAVLLIHPLNVSGLTLDYEVDGNSLSAISATIEEETAA